MARARLGRRFWLLWTASAISMIGDGIALAAFPLLAERVAGSSAFMVSVVFAAGRLPYLFAIHGGAVVDRADRRRLVLLVETGRAVLLAAFALYVSLADRPSIWLVTLTVFCIGAGQVLSDTATEVAVPEIVPSGLLGRANGLLYSVQGAGEQVVGPALGGVLFAAAVAVPFYVDGLTFVVAALLLPLAIPGRRPSRRLVVEERRPKLRDDVRQGLAYFRGDPLLVTLAGVVLTFAFCQSMVLAPLVVFSSDELGLGAKGYGLLIGVTSVGNVIGALVGGRVDTRLRIDVVLIVAGVVIAAAYIVAGSARSVVIVAVALFVEAVWVAIGNISSVTTRQRVIPPDLLGRAMGTFRLLILGCIPIGSIAGGLLASVVENATPMLVAGGLQLLAISLLGPRLHRAVRDDRRLAVGS